MLAAFAVSVSVPLVLGALGAAVTTPEIPGWYAELDKPSWNPPSWIFGPVWTLLYTTMGIAAWLVWKRGTSEEASPAQHSAARSALLLYGIQLMLNAIWSPVFFGLQRIDIALVIIALLLPAIAVTIQRFSRVSQAAAWLLLPYLSWATFATALNCSLWLLNR
jgi:tryptophan-rich sensory protein